MDLTLGQLAALIGGTLTDRRLEGARVAEIRSLAQAGPGDVSFYKGDPRYLPEARATRALAIIAEEPIEGAARPFVLVEDAGLAVSFLLAAVRDLQNPPPTGVDPRACVHASAELGEGVSVGPGAVIEARARVGARSRIGANAFVGTGAHLGEECVLHPSAIVLHGCRLGARVVLWPCAVIGRDGFGFLQRQGRHVRIPHVGGVVIGDDVEIGAWSSVDRGAVDPTVVGNGVKIDSHCHIAHNCTIGDNAMIIGYARMGGSARVGKNAVLAQDSALGERRSLGEGAIALSGAMCLYEDVPDGATVLGWPARPHMREKRIQVVTDKLPEMYRELRDLRKRLAALEAAAGGSADRP